MKNGPRTPAEVWDSFTEYARAGRPELLIVALRDPIYGNPSQSAREYLANVLDGVERPRKAVRRELQTGQAVMLLTSAALQLVHARAQGPVSTRDEQQFKRDAIAAIVGKTGAKATSVRRALNEAIRNEQAVEDAWRRSQRSKSADAMAWMANQLNR